MTKRYTERGEILATRADIDKAKATITRLRKEKSLLKLRADMAESHFAGLTREVEELRRRLGISKRDWKRKIR